MTIAIMQPYLFPYIGYFQLIAKVDHFVIYNDVNYINKGWINRNNILVNGKSHLFTLPLKKASQNKLINQVYIDNFSEWKNSFCKTIQNAYSRAPYFERVFSIIQQMFTNDTLTIDELNLEVLNQICSYLNIKTLFSKSSNLNINFEIKGQDRIISICKALEATSYINPIGGLDLYSDEFFQKNGIDLFFLRSNSFYYRQFENEYVPNLSIIDVLMFNSIEEISLLLKQCSMKKKETILN